MHGQPQKMKFHSKQFQRYSMFVLGSPPCDRTIVIVRNAGETYSGTIANLGRYNMDLDTRFKISGRVTTSTQRVRESVMVM